MTIPSDFISIFFPSILRSSKLLPFNPSDIKYIEEESSSIFSLTGFPNVSLSSVCPALILITGELLASLHPILIELPYLPSKTTSPSFTSICLISFFLLFLNYNYFLIHIFYEYILLKF